MSANLQRHHEFTEEEYCGRERDTEDKNEFQWGQIHAMAGTSTDHNRIAVDVTIALGNQLNGKSCEVFAGDHASKSRRRRCKPIPMFSSPARPFSYDAGDKHRCSMPS